MRAAVWALALFTAFNSKATQADWSYSTSTDEMRGHTVEMATIESISTITQEPPYARPARLQATVTRSDKGQGFMFELTEGQFLCAAKLCDVSMKFDSGQIIELKAAPAADTNSVLYVQNPNLFVATAKMAKALIIEVPVYRYGKAQFKFDVSGLEWEGKQPSKEGLYSGIAGLQWGAQYDDSLGLIPVPTESDDKCYKAPAVPKLLGVTPRAITHCFYKNAYHRAMVSVPPKQRSAVIKAVSQQTAKPDLVVDGYASWSDSEEKTLLHIAILGRSSSKDGALLMVDYLPIGNLVPEHKKPE